MKLEETYSYHIHTSRDETLARVDTLFYIPLGWKDLRDLVLTVDIAVSKNGVRVVFVRGKVGPDVPADRGLVKMAAAVALCAAVVPYFDVHAVVGACASGVWGAVNSGAVFGGEGDGEGGGALKSAKVRVWKCMMLFESVDG